MRIDRSVLRKRRKEVEHTTLFSTRKKNFEPAVPKMSLILRIKAQQTSANFDRKIAYELCVAHSMKPDWNCDVAGHLLMQIALPIAVQWNSIIQPQTPSPVVQVGLEIVIHSKYDVRF